ncbi:MAG TPA: thioesterase family protein [Thermoleophilaceae bacterium]|nr:thioesterase family protein [Thermoleophilaceae bacterium]
MLRSDYKHFLTVETRWMDNDVYGHVNNVVYYSFFDTAVNRYLIDEGVLDIRDGETIGFVVETACAYEKPIAFPDRVTAGIRVARIGTSSVRYEIGVFRNDDDESSAHGHFVHVYVDRATRRSRPIPETLRAALEKIS